MGHRRVGRIMRVGVLMTLVLVGCGDDDDGGAAGSDDGGASVSLTAPEDGSTVAGGVELEMSADGITIEEAGEVRENAGHFHVIVDDGCVAAGETVAKDADHVHFGKGQTTGTVYLGPGAHELCLQVADGAHTALDVTDTITVEAGISSPEEWCDVVGETDVLFEEVDTNGEDFPLRQVGYENLRRLFAQLDEAIDQVDAETRDAVVAALDVGTAITTAFIDASDEEEAAAQVQGIIQSAGPTFEAASPWIVDTCGVDING